jgi:thiamine-monophosphate kinase
MGPSERSPVSDIGESGLIDLVRERFGSAPTSEVWAGDDAAVVKTGARSLLTTDVLVEGVDFDLSYCTGYDIGWKALAVNVSDIAAMGGTPQRAVVSLALPSTTPRDVVESFIDGLDAGAERWGVGIVGGDVSGASEISVSVGLLGAVEGEPVLRSGARAGDAICVTGTLGGAAGGLFALQRGIGGHNGEMDRLVERQLRPVPRLAESVALRTSTSMIDVSDGLALDLTRLMSASGTGAELSRSAIPVDPALAALEDGPDPVALALGGGEDYELLCTVARSDLDRVRERLEDMAGLTEIGVVTDGGRCVLDGEVLEGEDYGWDHLRNR